MRINTNDEIRRSAAIEGEEAVSITSDIASTPIENKKVHTRFGHSKFRLALYDFFKRIFDFVSALLLSIVILIPMFILGLLIVMKDRGSPFYKQKRLGRSKKNRKKYNIIDIYKFRSMKKGADELEKMLTPKQLEEYKKEYKLKDDPRLIGYKNPGDGENGKCFGAKIRKMSLDELPQILFNICIIGNMSVVGPRPILQNELEKNYTEEERKKILSVKPGLTGYWQAYARNNATYESGERQKMELYYVENRSLWLDIKIFFRTIISVIKREGAE